MLALVNRAHTPDAQQLQYTVSMMVSQLRWDHARRELAEIRYLLSLDRHCLAADARLYVLPAPIAGAHVFDNSCAIDRNLLAPAEFVQLLVGRANGHRTKAIQFFPGRPVKKPCQRVVLIQSKALAQAVQA